MKILVVTPLFPPNQNDSARYCKELALQLSKTGHKVEVLTYGKFPESVSGVVINVVTQSLLIPIKLGVFIYKFFMSSLRQDLIIINNGPTTEFPSLFLYPFIGGKSIFVLSDEKATLGLKGVRKLTNSFLTKRLRTLEVNTDMYRKPEIHPFKNNILTEETFNRNWSQHQKEILNYA